MHVNKVVYNVYENFHDSDGQIGNYNYSTYSTFALAHARMEEVWKSKHYPIGKVEMYGLEWYYFDENTQIMYCIMIEPIIIRESLDDSKTTTNIVMITSLPPVTIHYPEL